MNITTNKNMFVKLYNNIISSILKINKQIFKVKQKCNKLCDFIKVINLFEIYKWNKIKNNFSNINKQINKYKLLKQKLIKQYGYLSIYYKLEEQTIINNNINELCLNFDILNFNFAKLKEIMYYTKIYLNNAKKRKKTLKIKIINNKNILLIKELYKYYEKIKEITNTINLLKLN
jgi:hypothetical protein